MKTKLHPKLHPMVHPLLLAALWAALALGLPAPAFAHSSHGRGNDYPYAPTAGRISVTNASGGDLSVTLSGQPTRRLPAWQSVSFTTAAGEAFLRATYAQFGAEQVLQTDRIAVVPGRTVDVTLAPERTARLLVVNQAPTEAQLLVDGRVNATFGPGASRIVALPAATHELTMVAAGRTLARTRMALLPFDEPRWLVTVPRVGDLVVSNPLPIPVQIVADSGLVRTVSPYGQVVLADLPLGSFHVLARRVSGEYVDATTADIRFGGATTWRVDAPRTGLLDLDSEHFLAADVYVDGRRMVTLAPDAEHRTVTTVGWHEVTAVDQRGREIARTWVEVEPFDVARVAFGTPSHVRADDRVGRYERGEPHHHGSDRGGMAEVGDGCSMN
jgi:hypothetical protein